MFVPPPEPESQPRQDPDGVVAYAAKLLAGGTPPRVVRQKLTELGLSEKDASLLVADLLQSSTATHQAGEPSEDEIIALEQMRRQALKAVGQRNMVVGALVCIVGVVITVVTLAASQGGGTYVIAWGAIVFGAIQFFRGLSQNGTQ